jgi:hypothetical protein
MEQNAKMLADRLLNSGLIQVLTSTFGSKGSKLNYIIEDTGLSEKAIHDALEVLKAYDLMEVMEGDNRNPSTYRSHLQKIEIIIAQGHANFNIVTTKTTTSMTLTTKELTNEVSFMKGLQGAIKAAFKDTFEYTKKAMLEAVKAEILEEIERKKAAEAPVKVLGVPRPKKESTRYFCSKCNKRHNAGTGPGKDHLKYKAEEKS